MSRTARRLLLLHAHPDDETLMTGGTIARYLAEGVDVRVLTFTLGEQGEVIGEEFAGLVADGGADQLGGYRILELTRALAALGPAGREPVTPRFLGGAGHWRDSGMAGTPAARHPRALVSARFDEVVATLVDEIAEFAPQVIIGYDAVGTYGHPDHITVHDAAVAAIPRAEQRLGGELTGGGPIKVYQSVTEAPGRDAALTAAADRLPDGWRLPEPGELAGVRPDQITTEIDVSEYYAPKVAAFRAHATQIAVADSGTEYALSNNVMQPIETVEHYILTGRARARLDADARETDLWAGLD